MIDKEQLERLREMLRARLPNVVCPKCHCEIVLKSGTECPSPKGKLYEARCLKCSHSWYRFCDISHLPYSNELSKLWRLEGGIAIQWEPWQVKYILDPILNHVTSSGRRVITNALCGLPKKNGKSTTAAVLALWGLLFDDAEPEVFGLASDKEQTKVIFDCVTRMIRRSPELLGELDLYRDCVARKDGMGNYRILSSDSPSAHGFNPSLVVIDELWTQRSYSLIEAVTESPTREQPLQLGITYAGMCQTAGYPLWDLYQKHIAGELDNRSYCFWSERNLFSKVTPEYLEVQQKRLPRNSYLRLHKNQWVDSSGEFLSDVEINNAVDDALCDGAENKVGYRYHLAVDLGLVHDKTAIALTHSEGNIVYLDRLVVVEGSKAKRVSVASVERRIEELLKSYRIASLVVDNWQLESTCQRLEARGIMVKRFTFSAAAHNKLTECLLQLFRESRIRIPRVPALITELKELHLETGANGSLRIEHSSDGFNDQVIALAMSCLACVEGSRKRMRGTAMASIITQPLYDGGYDLQRSCFRQALHERLDDTFSYN